LGFKDHARLADRISFTEFVSPEYSGQILRVSLTALFLLIFFAAQPQVNARVLVGEIEHAESVQPVEDDLRPGNTFSKSSLPSKGESGDSWYRIPNWLAGAWHKEEQTNYYRFNYTDGSTDNAARTQIARSDGRWGMQKDHNGQIWQYDPVPYSANIDAGNLSIVQIVRVCEPIQVTGERFVKRSVVTELRTDKATGKIISVATGEEISYYVPQSDVLVKRMTSSKVFDANGVPILLGRSYSYENRLSGFQEEDFYKGKDMKTLFEKFLKMSGSTACLHDFWNIPDQ